VSLGPVQAVVQSVSVQGLRIPLWEVVIAANGKTIDRCLFVSQAEAKAFAVLATEAFP
jgi:hypothetical protein